MFGTHVNTQPVVVETAKARIENADGKLVKIDTDGSVCICNVVGDSVFGIVRSEAKDVESGEDVTVQVTAMGTVIAGDVFSKGDALTTNDKGLAIKASDGNYVFGMALEAATAANDVIKVLITHNGK